MNWKSRVVRALLTVVGCAVAADLGPAIGATAQQPAGQGSERGAGGPAAVLFTLIDGNKDSAVTRDEMKAVFDKWYGEWDAKKSNALTQEHLHGRERRVPGSRGGTDAAAESDAASGRRQGDDGLAPRRGAGQAQATAEGARPRQGGRLRALLDFVRGGKGLAGIHAASDSYHRSSTQKPGGGGFNFQVIPVVMQMLAGDRNSDGRLSREEFTGLADSWYDKFDVDKTGRISQADFSQRFAALPPAAQPAARGGGNGQDAPPTSVRTRKSGPGPSSTR